MLPRKLQDWRLIAVHEGGHAVAAVMLGVGVEFARVWLDPDSGVAMMGGGDDPGYVSNLASCKAVGAILSEWGGDYERSLDDRRGVRRLGEIYSDMTGGREMSDPFAVAALMVGLDCFQDAVVAVARALLNPLPGRKVPGEEIAALVAPYVPEPAPAPTRGPAPDEARAATLAECGRRATNQLLDATVRRDAGRARREREAPRRGRDRVVVPVLPSPVVWA